MTYSLYAASDGYHKIVSIDTAPKIIEYFNKADKDCLIFIDVDSTLTTVSDPDLRRHAIRKHKEIYDSLLAPLTDNQKRIFNHLLVMASPSQLVEDTWPEIISQIQRKGIKTLALTAAKTGKINSTISSFPNWRFNELKRLGIDFSRDFSGSVFFDSLKDYGGDFPGLEKGIVYCGHQAAKGDLLTHVLSAINFTPSLIIFIDDKRENLESMSQAIRHLFPSIQFIGIHYTGIEKFDSPLTEEKVFYDKFHALVERTKAITF